MSLGGIALAEAPGTSADAARVAARVAARQQLRPRNARPAIGDPRAPQAVLIALNQNIKDGRGEQTLRRLLPRPRGQTGGVLPEGVAEVD